MSEPEAAARADASLPHYLAFAPQLAQWHLARVEFLTTKSQAAQRHRRAQYHQAWAEHWARLQELLQELAQLRNACQRAGINPDWTL